MTTEKEASSPGGRIAVVAVLALVGVVLVASIINGWWMRPDDPVRIAVSKTPLSAPVYIADEKGYFAKHCSSVELVEVVGGKRSFETMASGQADFATSSDSVIVYKAFARSDFAALASFVQADNDVKFITREGLAQQHYGTTRFSSVGVTKGTASEYFLSTYLALEGIDVTNITLLDTPPDEMPEVLASGSVDAIVPWEPYGYKAVQMLEGVANVLPTKNLYSLSFNLIGQKNDIEMQPHKAECVLKALSDAIDFIASEPSETQQVIGSRLNLESDFIFWIWPDYIFKLSLNKSLLMNLQSQAEWVVEAGIIKGQAVPDFMTVLNPRPLSKVKPEAASLLDKPQLSSLYEQDY